MKNYPAISHLVLTPTLLSASFQDLQMSQLKMLRELSILSQLQCS